MEAGRSEEATQRFEAQKRIEEDRISMFFVDHVIENDKKQDIIMVASIIDALLAPIKVKLPEVVEVCFISDNANNYQNDLLPVIVPIICRTHDIGIHSILHPDAFYGKSCVDGHFAVFWRHVKRYIEELKVT